MVWYGDSYRCWTCQDECLFRSARSVMGGVNIEVGHSISTEGRLACAHGPGSRTVSVIWMEWTKELPQASSLRMKHFQPVIWYLEWTRRCIACSLSLREDSDQELREETRTNETQVIQRKYNNLQDQSAIAR